MGGTLSISGRRVVIVGAAGFLGRACTRALAKAGAEVIGVDVAPSGDPAARGWLVADVLAHGLPKEALEQADTLINLAWRNDPGRGNRDMEHDVLGNVVGAVRVFEQAALSGVRRLIYASSGGTIYGRAAAPTAEDTPIAPIGGYGAGKASAELYLNAIHHAYGTQTCTLRIANPYGPGQYPNRGQGFIATAIARTLERQPIEIFGSDQISRDYVYIEDVAEAMALAAADDSPQLTLNVGSGTGHSLAELIERIFAKVGHATEVRRTEGRAMDVPKMALDVSRIAAVLGWRPTTSLDAGLERSIAWIDQLLRDGRPG